MEIQDKTQIKAALRQSYGSIVYAMNDLDEISFLKSPAEGKWSPADILGHLILSTMPLNKAMSTPKLILKASFGTTNREDRTIAQTKEKYYNGLATGVKAPSNFIFQGAAEKGKEAMINKFTDQLKKLLSNIDKWSEKDLSNYILPHPAIGKLTIREMLFFAHFHAEHHLKQVVVSAPLNHRESALDSCVEGD